MSLRDHILVLSCSFSLLTCDGLPSGEKDIGGCTQSGCQGIEILSLLNNAFILRIVNYVHYLQCCPLCRPRFAWRLRAIRWRPGKASCLCFGAVAGERPGSVRASLFSTVAGKRPGSVRASLFSTVAGKRPGSVRASLFSTVAGKRPGSVRASLLRNGSGKETGQRPGVSVTER